MNCKEFSTMMGDYVNRTLGEENAGQAEVHLAGCTACASRVRELESTSVMVRSLDRASAPAGFEERLKARLAVERAQAPRSPWTTVQTWLQTAGRALWGVPGHRTALRPALTALALCALIVGSMLMWSPDRSSGGSDTDWAYINACRDQHASFAGSNPLGDESAAALRERADDLGEAL